MTRKQAISATLDILIDVADTHHGASGIVSAIGELEANGIMYQVQLHLVSDKRAWLKENDVMFTDFTSVQKTTV